MADSKISALTAHTSVSDSDELVIVDNSGTATSKKITKKNLVKDIVNVDVASSAAIDFSKLAALTSASILVGNGSNVATSVAISGDIAIDNAGATTIQTDAVDIAMLSATGTASSSTYLRGDNAWSQITGIPSGVILMWSGTLANIPSGWNLCDGNNGTPNLIAKFVRSIATASTEAGSTGGSDSVTLTGAQSGTSAHGHSGSTNTTGSHSHSYTAPALSAGLGQWSNQKVNETASGTTGSSGNHSHTVTINNASEADASSSHENRPAYFELAYIMKA